MGRDSREMRLWGPAIAVVLLASTVAVDQQEHVTALSDLARSGESLLAVAEGTTATKITIDLKGKGAKRKTGYIRIPNFVMKHMGQELNVRGPAACEKECDKHKDCKSYSFRAKDNLCVWSIEAMHYRYDWTFYTKVHEMNAFGKMKHNGKYRKFPGIVYQEPGYAKYKNKSVHQCQTICTKVKKCKASSYHKSQATQNTKTKVCISVKQSAPKLKSAKRPVITRARLRKIQKQKCASVSNNLHQS